MPSDVISGLRDLLPDGRVLTDPSELFVYDADGFTIPRTPPGAVLFPDSTEEVVRVVKHLAASGIEIVPRGSGTGLAGGCIAMQGGVVVSTARMNRVLRIDIPSRVAHVEAGVRNVQLSEAVAAVPGGAAYHFSPDPSSQRASSVGGNASTNAGGIHCLKDFVTANHVYGIEMVLPDGERLTIGGEHGATSRGPFDLPGLVCGHEGTFGIITRLWVRLTPKPTHFRTVVSVFTTTRDACQTVADVIATGMLPSAMEMLDGKMVEVLENCYHFGFPKEAAALVLTEIDGIDELLDQQMNEIADLSRRNNAFSVQTTSKESERAKLWKARKSAFGAIGRISVSYCTQDACVPRSKLPDVLAAIHRIAQAHGIEITNVFHAGDGNVHPIFLYDERDKAQVQSVLEASAQVLSYCIDVGGTLTGEHGVGIEKVGLMEYLFDGPTMAQFARVKSAFDPQGRVNVGKLLPSDSVNVRLMKPGRMAPQ